MNLIEVFGLLQQIKQDPKGVISRYVNLSNDVNYNDPNDIMRHLVSGGYAKQSDIDAIKNGIGGFLH